MTSIAEVAHREELHTQPLTHSPRLFDAPGTEAFTSEYEFGIHLMHLVLYTKEAK